MKDLADSEYRREVWQVTILCGFFMGMLAGILMWVP